MRLKKERWLVKKQMRHVQEKHKISMNTEEQKCLPEERCKRMNEQNQLLNEEQERLSDEDMEVPQAIEKVLALRSEQVQMLSADPDAVAQPVTVEEEKNSSRDSSNVPSIFSKDETKERVDSDDDKIEEETPKLPKKLKELSRMTVVKSQQKVNSKASSNIVLVPQHWSFKRKHSQDKDGIEKLAWKLPDFIKRTGVMKIRDDHR
ncbi:uncharacterized protein TNIN_239621 [Trichonephila inaurata madagascariensis]|uniref:DUF382 domain-containing protein n=1 Tax=Trichonephila inaurata madagascariensis TaxID=2747483 RepID=A0A8X6YFB7_9ARAC|nr:uncharacterized protein TNIN_239621 [Trichonephila inaurata madagascariensis]